MYNLHINHEPDDVEYPFKGWFFGWVKDQCNEGYAGCDAIYAAKSKTLTGPWLVYSGDNLDGSAKWTTDKFIDQWVPVLAGGPNNYDNWHNGDPSVIRHNDLYYMAYSATGHNRDGIPFGQSGDTDSDISVVMGATSQDGINWIKSEEPILIYDPQWGQSPMKKGDYMHEFGSYHRPSLIFEDGKFKLWFDAYVKDNFHTLYAENSENFMVKNDWNIKRGMAKPALKNFPNTKEKLKSKTSTARFVKLDVFRSKMYYYNLDEPGSDLLEFDAIKAKELIVTDHPVVISGNAVSYTHLTLPTKRIV